MLPRQINRRQLLLFGLGAVTGATTVALGQWFRQRRRWLDVGDRTFPIVGQQSLRERAAAKGLLYGAAISYDEITEDAEFVEQLVRECQILTPENELKWSRLRPSPTTYEFAVADEMVAFAQERQMQVRGHALVWHRSLPDWFAETATPDNAEALMREHIETVATRYAGVVHSWDVVNEAILPEHDQPNGMRQTPWLELLGEGFIDLAFRMAREADPQALLFYNDFNLDFAIRQDERKRRAVLALLERLVAQGTPIDGLGIQGHLSGRQVPFFDAEVMRGFLRDVASLGLKIMITEIDVIDKDWPADLATRDRLVAAAYEDYLSVVLEEPAVIGVVSWGLSDRYTWLSSFHPRDDGLPVRPLPLDDTLQPKLAWNAIARAFDHAPPRRL